MSAHDDLQNELLRLRAAVARRMREKLEAEGEIQPAYLEACRKFLADQLRPERAHASPITVDLPYPAPEDAE